MHDKPINVGRLIYENIKPVGDAKHQTCGHFCVINESCKLSGVRSHQDDDMIQSIVSINTNFMRTMPIGPIHQPGKRVVQEKEKEQYYPPEASQSREA